MKKITALLFTVLAAGCGSDSGKTELPARPPEPASAKPAMQTAEHVDTANGVRFRLPAGWIVQQRKDGLMFISPTGDEEDPAIGYTKPLPKGPDGKLLDFGKAAGKAAAEVPKVEPSARDFKQESVKVSGKDALQLSFNLKMEGSAYRSRQIYCGGKSGGCLVQFSYPTAAEAAYAPVLKTVLESLKPAGK